MGAKVRLLDDGSLVVPAGLALVVLNELVRQHPCAANYRELRDACRRADGREGETHEGE